MPVGCRCGCTCIERGWKPPHYLWLYVSLAVLDRFLFARIHRPSPLNASDVQGPPPKMEESRKCLRRPSSRCSLGVTCPPPPALHWPFLPCEIVIFCRSFSPRELRRSKMLRMARQNGPWQVWLYRRIYRCFATAWIGPCFVVPSVLKWGARCDYRSYG